MLLLVFHVGDRHYALHYEAVERVIRAVEVTPLPDAPEDILGVINVYGRIVPVLNVRKRLGLPDRDMELNDHLIITQTTKWPIALWVDRVSGVLDYPISREVLLRDILPEGLSVEGVIKLEEGLAFIEDMDRFYSPLPNAQIG
ncbi:MAG: cheW2 [Proteobacteria bacterium]|nr:cheW2 [Pseudomonadota bacterium]